MPIREASRIYRARSGFFYFRLVFSPDLNATAGQREVRFSLLTECRWEANIFL